ncbi:hypothetical protein GCM10027072_74310 [Streptomyces bullii]
MITAFAGCLRREQHGVWDTCRTAQGALRNAQCNGRHPCRNAASAAMCLRLVALTTEAESHEDAE